MHNGRMDTCHSYMNLRGSIDYRDTIILSNLVAEHA